MSTARAPDSVFPSALFAFRLALYAALAVLLIPGPLPGQDADAASTRDIVVRFAIPEDAFADATTSVEIVQVLRDQLTIELAMPLDEELRVVLRGVAGVRQGSGPPYHLLLGSLGVGVAGRQPRAEYSYALAVRESHGDFPDNPWAALDSWEEWIEEDAWNSLVTALDIGPAQSHGAFTRPAEGQHAPLRVKSVQIQEFTMAPEDSAWADFTYYSYDDRAAVLEIKPDISHQSAQEGVTPDDIRYHLNILVLELGPGDSGEAMAAAGAAEAGAEAGGAAASDLSTEDAEALEISEGFAFACDPQELQSAVDVSASIVNFDGEQRIGQAVYGVEGDRDLIIILGKVDAENPYCLMMASPGGFPELGLSAESSFT